MASHKKVDFVEDYVLAGYDHSRLVRSTLEGQHSERLELIDIRNSKRLRTATSLQLRYISKVATLRKGGMAVLTYNPPPCIRGSAFYCLEEAGWESE